MYNQTDSYFTFEDLSRIVEIKDRVIKTLLVGGGGALYDNEKNEFDFLLAKAKRCLKNCSIQY